MTTQVGNDTNGEFIGFGNDDGPFELPEVPAVPELAADGSDPEAPAVPESGTDEEGAAEADPAAVAATQSPEATARVERLVQSLPDFDTQLDTIAAQAQALSEPINLDPLSYQDDASYQRALATAAARDVQMRALHGQYQQVEAAKSQARVAVWDQQAAAGRAKYKDFDAVVGGSNFQPSKAMAEAIVSSPAGADIAYHLSKNPQLGARIARLSPMAAAMEIGRLSATVGKAQPVTQRRTNAPPPAPTVSGSRSPTARKVSDMSVDEIGKLLYN